MTYERTADWELVRHIIRHPKVYPWVSDDFSPAAADFRPVVDLRVWYVLVRDDKDELLGLFMFVWHSPVLCEVHTCLLPHAWGAAAAEAARGAAAWLFERTDCARIITSVPAYNRLALRFARAAGMEQYGVNPSSYQKNAKLHDQVLLGLSRDGEQRCQQQ